MVKYHIHIHVSVYVNGPMMRLPGGVGITKPPLIEKYKTGNFYDVGLYDCLYWIHAHVADGNIHVEAPVKQSFTLRPVSIDKRLASRINSLKALVSAWQNEPQI